MAKLQHYIHVGRQKLRCGYTTGTCATAAALGATQVLLQGAFPESVSLETPAGILVELDILNVQMGPNMAQCTVCKDGGDDPDVTDGTPIIATVSRSDTLGITIDGGVGVGRVTKPGLDQAVGQAAINSVPRRMITQALTPYIEGKDFGLAVEISAPLGEQLAQRTFNPRMGVVGGISILGTSGIVRPMSEAALKASIALEIHVLRVNGQDHLVLSPGNYGADFSRDTLEIDMTHAAVCSNFIGFAIDCAEKEGFTSVLLVGHLGKLSKVAAGAMDTHSKVCDPRREVFCTHAVLCGGDGSLCKALYETVTADGAVALLQQAGLLTQTMTSMATAMEDHLSHRAAPMAVGAVFFSNQYGILGQTTQAEQLLRHHRLPPEQE